MTKKETAGARLRSDLDRALARAAEDQGVAALEFTEQERHLVTTAVEMADWAEQLKAHRDAELAGQARATTPRAPQRRGTPLRASGA
jgi:hypothetical protein